MKVLSHNEIQTVSGGFISPVTLQIEAFLMGAVFGSLVCLGVVQYISWLNQKEVSSSHNKNCVKPVNGTNVSAAI